MIHDATVQVTCDYAHCCENVEITPSHVGTGIMHTNVVLDDSDKAIEEKLPSHGWAVKDGKHFCPGHKPKTK